MTASVSAVDVYVGEWDIVIPAYVKGADNKIYTVISISDGAFDAMTGPTNYGIKSVTIPDTVENIGKQAFLAWPGMTLTINNLSSNLKTIGSQAFQYCIFTQTNLVLSEGLETIGMGAFMGCSGLTTITINATTPPTLGGSSAIPDNVTEIRVPSASLSAYQSATNWSSFAWKMVGF